MCVLSYRWFHAKSPPPLTFFFNLGCLYVYMIYTKSVYIACIYTLYIQYMQFSYTCVYIHIYRFFKNSYTVYIYIIYTKIVYIIYTERQSILISANNIGKFQFCNGQCCIYTCIYTKSQNFIYSVYIHIYRLISNFIYSVYILYI